MAEKDRFTSALDEFLDSLLVEQGASPATVRAYRADLEQVQELLAGRGLASWDEMSAQDAISWQAALGPPMKPATAERKQSALRSFVKWMKSCGRLEELSLPESLGSRRGRRLPKALSLGEMGAILGAPDLASPIGLRDRAMMELIYGAGLRISECCQLRLDELLMDSAMARVTGKRGKTRLVPLPPATLAWLERWLAEGRPALAVKPRAEVFLGAKGGAILRTTAARQLASHTRAAGIEKAVSPHTLRHTYAVHLLKGGADLRAVQELLGHESIATTQVYTMLDMDEVRRKYQAAHPRR